VAALCPRRAGWLESTWRWASESGSQVRTRAESEAALREQNPTRMESVQQPWGAKAPRRYQVSPLVSPQRPLPSLCVHFRPNSEGAPEPGTPSRRRSFSDG